MARKSGVWYRDQESAFYTTIRGKQIRLIEGPNDKPRGPIYRRACEKLDALLRGTALPEDDRVDTVGQLVRRYLAHQHVHRRKGTARICERLLRPFGEKFSDRSPLNLTETDVARFFDEHKPSSPVSGRHRGWSASTQHLCCIQINAMLAYYERRLKIGTGVCGRFHFGSPGSRVESGLISHKEAATLLERAGPRLREFLTVMKATGARPGELCGASIEDFNPEQATIRFARDAVRKGDRFRHKTAGHGIDRVIVLNAEALAVVRRRIGRRTSGPIFLSNYKGRLSTHTIQAACWALRKKCGIPQFTPMSFRHLFATDMILGGMRAEELAPLMGTSPAVINRHYANPLREVQVLRAAMEAARSRREEQMRRVI